MDMGAGEIFSPDPTCVGAFSHGWQVGFLVDPQCLHIPCFSFTNLSQNLMFPKAFMAYKNGSHWFWAHPKY